MSRRQPSGRQQQCVLGRRYRRLHTLCSHVAATVDDEIVTDGRAAVGSGSGSSKVLRLGVVGLDSSHGVGFARELNKASSDHNARIIGCVQHGTGYNGGPVIDAMRDNLAKHAEEMAGLGAPSFRTVPELLDLVDAVFLTSWDGRVR
jgi:hypothetical protein